MRQAVYVDKTRPALYQVRRLKTKERTGMKHRPRGLTQLQWCLLHASHVAILTSYNR